jgi:putative acetyltransferase
MTHMVTREERSDDAGAIRQVNDAAFGQDVEGVLVDALRRDGAALLSLVAEIDGTIVGHVLFSRLTITGPGPGTACALAPVAVAPAVQRQGIGSRLIREGLRILAERGERAVVVLGDPRYYRRFGFEAELVQHFDTPYAGDALMGLDLVAGALHSLQGSLIYPVAFARTDADDRATPQP